MENITNNSKFYFILALCWMATLYVLSSIPQLADYNTFTGQDKIEHLLAFAVLGFLLMRSFQPSAEPTWSDQDMRCDPRPGKFRLCLLQIRRLFLDGKRLVFYRVLLVTVLVAAYGALDEFHQLFVPGRTASLADFATDAMGGFLGAFFVFVLRFHATDKT